MLSSSLKPMAFLLRAHLSSRVHVSTTVTPIEVRQFYEREPSLTIFELEDEIFESEVLVERGAFRTYMKASAACSDGSTIYAVVGPAGTGSVPSPTGR